MKNLFPVLLLLVSLLSCNNKESEPKIVLSKDKTQLAKVLEYKSFVPDSVQYQYTIHNNSGIMFSGPSDYYLEAVLYYDDTAFKKLLQEYQNVDYTASYFPEDFYFRWLPENIKTELTNNPKDYSGHPDLFFCKHHTSLWLLKNKFFLNLTPTNCAYGKTLL